MTDLVTKVKRLTGVAAAVSAASMAGLTMLGAGAGPVMAASTSYITQTKAKTAALNHAKIKASQIYDLDIDLERGKRVTYYDVEFKANGYEYDYEINAENATVIKSSKKALKTTKTTKTTTAAAKTTTSGSKAKVSYIGANKAQTIALKHAKLTAAKVKGLKAELDKENGIYIYDVDFKSGNYKYDYDINATTGKVIKFEKKAVKKTTSSTGKTSSTTTKTSYIGVSKAKNIALNHAKLSASKVRGLKAELDRERGIYVYEVEFKSGRYEYDYTINATTGKVISSDKEFDD